MGNRRFDFAGRPAKVKSAQQKKGTQMKSLLLAAFLRWSQNLSVTFKRGAEVHGETPRQLIHQ